MCPWIKFHRLAEKTSALRATELMMRRIPQTLSLPRCTRSTGYRSTRSLTHSPRLVKMAATSFGTRTTKASLRALSQAHALSRRETTSRTLSSLLTRLAMTGVREPKNSRRVLLHTPLSFSSGKSRKTKLTSPLLPLQLGDD